MKDGRQPAALYHRVQADNSVNWKVVGQVGTNPKQGSHYGELQTIRLAEVQAMTPVEWQKLRAEMAQASKLPKLIEHFRKHAEQFVDLGITDVQGLNALFLEHIRRTDLKIFTYASTQKKAYRQWVLVGMDNGVVALYNESKKTHWSFMRQVRLDEYLAGGRGWWLRVENLLGKVKVQRW